MPADPGRDDFGLGVGHGQGADQVDQLHRLAPGLAVLGGAGASDLDHLGSCRKVHPPGGLNRLDGAPHPPPVRGVDARDGWDILPGQGLERLAQGLLVALDGEHVVTATLGGSTRRYRFGCAWRQWLPRPRPGRGAQASPSEPGPLVGLVRHPLLGQYSARGVVQSTPVMA